MARFLNSPQTPPVLGIVVPTFHALFMRCCWYMVLKFTTHHVLTIVICNALAQHSKKYDTVPNVLCSPRISRAHGESHTDGLPARHDPSRVRRDVSSGALFERANHGRSSSLLVPPRFTLPHAVLPNIRTMPCTTFPQTGGGRGRAHHNRCSVSHDPGVRVSRVPRRSPFLVHPIVTWIIPSLHTVHS